MDWPNDKLVRTDTPRGWAVDDVRPGNKYEVKAIHPTTSATKSAATGKSQNVTRSRRVTEVPAIILRRGTRALVRVTDPSEQEPVADARDLGETIRIFGHATTAVLTDAKRLLRFASVSRKGRYESAWCLEDWMPDSREVNIAPEHASGRFSSCDPAGNSRFGSSTGLPAPLPGVFVSIERWARSVRNLASANMNGVVVSSRSRTPLDKQGIFEWDWRMPDDAGCVNYGFGIKGSFPTWSRR